MDMAGLTRLPSPRHVVVLVLTAFVLWALVFGLKLVNFWFGLSLAAALLAGLSIYVAGLPLRRDELSWRGPLAGLISAAVLYGIFGLADSLAPLLLPFAQREVLGIYDIKQQADPTIILLLLIFVTSPAEELFWRGFLQRFLVSRLGGVWGLLLAAGLYAAVHVVSGNFMLVATALTAGLFWGLLYQMTNSLLICIISHSFWTVAIFVLWPLH